MAHILKTTIWSNTSNVTGQHDKSWPKLGLAHTVEQKKSLLSHQECHLLFFGLSSSSGKRWIIRFTNFQPTWNRRISWIFLKRLRWPFLKKAVRIWMGLFFSATDSSLFTTMVVRENVHIDEAVIVVGSVSVEQLLLSLLLLLWLLEDWVNNRYSVEIVLFELGWCSTLFQLLTDLQTPLALALVSQCKGVRITFGCLLTMTKFEIRQISPLLALFNSDFSSKDPDDSKRNSD